MSKVSFAICYKIYVNGSADESSSVKVSKYGNDNGDENLSVSRTTTVKIVEIILSSYSAPTKSEIPLSNKS